MDALKASVADIPRVIVEPITRFFFKKYPYRVTYAAEAYSEKFDEPEGNPKLRWRTSGRRILQGLDLKGDATDRNTEGFCALFFQFEEDAVAAVQIIGKYVSSVAGPRNQAERDVLAIDSKTRVQTVIRPTLFWAKYRYCITLRANVDDKNQGKSQLEEIANWLSDFSAMNPDEDRLMISYSTPRRVYFSDENDLLYFKLVFHSSILSIQKTLLSKEISDEQFASQDAR